MSLRFVYYSILVRSENAVLHNCSTVPRKKNQKRISRFRYEKFPSAINQEKVHHKNYLPTIMTSLMTYFLLLTRPSRVNFFPRPLRTKFDARPAARAKEKKHKKE